MATPAPRLQPNEFAITSCPRYGRRVHRFLPGLSLTLLLVTAAAPSQAQDRTLTINVNGLGTVTRSHPGPTYPNGSIVVLTAIPEAGNQFVNWTSGPFSTTTNPFHLTMDQNHELDANFVRVPLSYTRTTLASAYTPITVAGGATRILNAANDSTRSLPLPFRFVYSGLAYTTSNFLAVSANGFVFLSRSSVTTSLSSHGNNAFLYSSVTPNGVIAPWYDDLNVNAVGSNPQGAVLYQTQGSPGSRTLTVQWTNVSSFVNTDGGQPRQINFQAVFHEGTNVIEFKYGAVTGSRSTLETASIGIEDSLGGNYVDAVTGSRVTSNLMMTTNKWPTRSIRFTPGAPSPIAAGSYDVGVSGAYPSLSEAVADLNHRGVSGPVTMRLIDAVYDSSASGGANIFPILLSPIAGASASNPVTIQPASGTAEVRHRGTDNGSCGNLISSNVITNANEPIVGLVGTDYVTLRNLALRGGPSSDRGVLVIPASASDGAQNNTCEGVSVILSRGNPSSIALQQIVTTTPADEGGTNSFNRYYTIGIADVSAAISLAGNGSILDRGCEVGSATIGFFPGDIGSSPSQSFGIRATNQRDVRIFNSDIRHVQSIGTGSIDGILIDNQGSSSASSGTVEVFGNRVHELDNSASNGGVVTGIRVDLTSGPGSSSRIYNNFVYALNTASTATNSRRLIGIHVQSGGGGVGATHHVDFNSVHMAPSQAIAPNSCFELGANNGAVIKVRNNIFANFVGTQQGSGKHYAWVAPGASIGPAGSVSNHNVLHINNVANGFIGLIGSQDRASLSDWQTASGNDNASFSGNPEFESDIDLHINPARPSPVEGQGSFLAGDINWVPTDIDNQARNGSGPDIGADEGSFRLLGARDMAASAFIEPPAGSMKIAGASFTPSATFSNAGLAAQTSVPVRFRITGPLPSTAAVYNQTGMIASIGPGSSQSVTFPATSVAATGTYTMEARSELFDDDSAVNDTIKASLEIAGPMSGSFRVGFNRPAPFNTLTGAIERVTQVGLAGHVTLLLEDPTYTSESLPITINPISGAGPAQTLTLKPAPGTVTEIAGASTRAVIILAGADHVVIDGSNTGGGTTRDLTVRNTSLSTGTGVIWGHTTSSGDAVTNVTIKNLAVHGHHSSETMIGIGFGATTISNLSNGTNNHNNVVENCKVTRVQYGLYSAGANANNRNNGTIFRRNNIDSPSPDNVGRGGILLRFENGPLVTENVIAEIHPGPASVSPFGIALGLTNFSSEGFVGDEVTGATVTRNKIDGIIFVGSQGLSAAGITVAEARSGVTTIANNMVSRVLSSSLDPDMTVGLLVGGGTGSTTRIYFNSVGLAGSRGFATAPSFALAIGGVNPTVDLRNNILSNTETSTSVGDSYAIGLAYGSPYTGLTSNFNDLHATGGQLGIVGGLLNSPTGDRTTLSTWRSAVGKDANSISASPLFVSDRNLHITQSGSPVANAGSAIAGVTVDFDGEPGNRTTTPDIGADEFGTHTLNVTVVGTGNVAKNPNLSNYVTGSIVQLTATPGPEYNFGSWSGDASGSANPLSVTMDRSKSITATFVRTVVDSGPYTLGVAVAGSGTVQRDVNQPTYPRNSTVTLTAVPAAGHHFVSWSGDASGTGNPLPILMDGNKSITATFAINTYSLTVASQGTGFVNVTPNQPLYDHGASVSLNAVPGAGYHFVSWTGGASGSTNPLSVVMDTDKDITAIFEINTYALNVTVAGNGSVTKNPDQALYNHGTQVVLTAVPAPGHHLVSWTGSNTGSDDQLSVTMDQARDITATFAINTYTLNVSWSGNGSVSQSPVQPTYNHGTEVLLLPQATAGHHFTAWGGDTTSYPESLRIVMTRNRVVTADFANNAAGHVVNVSVVGSGMVARYPDLANYPYREGVLVVAAPAEGWRFVGWSGDTTTTSRGLELTMLRDRNLTATFEAITYTLDVLVEGGEATIGRNPNQPGFGPGTLVDLNAFPAAGYQFLRWIHGPDTLVGNPISFTLDSNMTVRLVVTAGPAPTITVNTVGSGTVIRDPDVPSFPQNTWFSLTAVPANGYRFAGWSGAELPTGLMSNPRFLFQDRNREITATFVPDGSVIGLTVVGGGTVVKNPDLALYPRGSTATLTAVPDPGYHFIGWTGDFDTALNPLSMVMDEDRNVTATFGFALNLAAVGEGSLQPAPSQPYHVAGSSVQVTAVPASGYYFAGWAGDASGNSNPLSIMMGSDKSVTATFEPLTNAILVEISGSGSVVKNPDQDNYAQGTEVLLTAMPEPGWHFAGWREAGGDREIRPGDLPSRPRDATGTDNPLTLLMNGSRTVIATFEMDNPPLVVMKRNAEARTLIPGTIARFEWSNDQAGVRSVDLFLSRGPEGAAAVVIAEGVPNTGSYEWRVTGTPSASCLLRIVAHGEAGNTSTDTLQVAIARPPAAPVTEFALGQPAPNPSAGAIRCEFAVPEPAHLRLSVLDLQGREVALLSEAVFEPGRHQVLWNGRTGRGPAPAGIYFLRLHTPKRDFVRRLVLSP